MIVFAISQARSGKTMNDLQPYLNEELKYGWQLYKDGISRAIHLRSDAIGVVIVLECKSVEEAKAYCSKFPLVQNEVIDFTYIPVTPFTLWELMK